jgi:hypothetical protein
MKQVDAANVVNNEDSHAQKNVMNLSHNASSRDL